MRVAAVHIFTFIFKQETAMKAAGALAPFKMQSATVAAVLFLMIN